MCSTRSLSTSLERSCLIRNLRAHRLHAAPPERFAGLRVLHRSLAPRHPPRTLCSLFSLVRPLRVLSCASRIRSCWRTKGTHGVVSIACLSLCVNGCVLADFLCFNSCSFNLDGFLTVGKIEEIMIFSCSMCVPLARSPPCVRCFDTMPHFQMLVNTFWTSFLPFPKSLSW